MIFSELWSHPERRKGSGTVCHCARVLLFALVFYASTGSAAERAGSRFTVLAVLSHDEAIYHAAMAGIKEGFLPDSTIEIRSAILTSSTTLATLDNQAAQVDVIIPIGTSAARQVLGLGTTVPVYIALVPSVTYGTMLREYRKSSGNESRQISAVYIDQPYARQMDLIRAALPGYRNIGVVLGPTSRAAEKQLRSAAEARQLSVHAETVDGDKSLYRALSSALSDSEVMLAVPDPDVYNRHTAQNVLLETYRQRKPVIGYSSAYVNAGALAAVYSTPNQIGKQLSEALIEMRSRADRKLPSPAYPRYFSVVVNQRVARSLGIEIRGADELRARMAGMEDRL